MQLKKAAQNALLIQWTVDINLKPTRCIQNEIVLF